MKVSVELPLSLKRDYQSEVVKNIYWLDSKILSVRYSAENEQVIHIEYAGDEFGAEIRKGITEAAVNIIKSIDRIPISRVFEREANSDNKFPDPHLELEARGWITPLFAGGYAYHGLVLQLITGLDRVFRENALSLASEEHWFPGLLSYKSAKRCGYLNSYPQNANLVCHLNEDLNDLRAFQENLKAGKNLDDHFAEPDLICSPTICHHYWQGLADKTHDINGLKVGTAVGSCHRFESRATTGLERLREFKMREIFAIGVPARIAHFRDRLVAEQKVFLDEFELESCIETATDPFFVDTYATKRVYQVGLNLKFEVKAKLPYKSEWLAISSVNYHENFFANAFDIKSSNEEKLHSCCVGFGLDRWALAIFAQHGLKPEKWPGQLQKLIQV